MSTVALALEILLGSALLVAASGKFLDAGAWRTARTDIGLGIPKAAWRALPFAEAAVGIALGIGLRPWAGVAATLLFTSFAIVLAIGFQRGVRADCNCFGAVLPTRVGPMAIGRAVMLASMSAALVFGASATEPLHPLGVAVPMTATALASLYSSIRLRVL